MRFFLCAVMALSAAAQTPGTASKEGAAPAGNAQNGKRIFDSYGCYQCHGHDAHGGAEPLPQRLSFKELHHEIVRLPLAADVEDRHDVRVGE